MKRQRSKPGTELRAIRSELHRIETKGAIPGIHRLYTLAHVYGRSLNKILSLYGIPLS